MIFFIRNKQNRTIIETELYTKTREDGTYYHEISSAVLLGPYTMFVIKNPENALKIAAMFDTINEIRGWLWENYYMNKDNVGSEEDYNNIYEFVDKLYKTVAKEFDLLYVKD